MEKVRVGIIGTSWWTEIMFLPNLAAHPSAELVAICGRNRERGEELAKKYGTAEVYTNYRTLIKEAAIDAIVVAAPDDLHYPMVMEALDAGLHILCEKPMALTVAHAKEMTEKAEAAGVKHMVLFTWRWIPVFQYAKQLVDSGYIGRCYQASFRFLLGFGRNPEYTWRSDGERSNGVFSDLGAHMSDFALWFVGDVKRVSANLGTFVEHPPADNREAYKSSHDAAFVLLDFADQGQGMIQTSAVTYKPEQDMEVSVELYGEAGSLEVTYIHSISGGEGVIRGAKDGEETFSLLELPEALTKDIDLTTLGSSFVNRSVGPRLFIDSILEDKQPSPNFNDGLSVQEVIGAALKSHETGGWVRVGND